MSYDISVIKNVLILGVGDKWPRISEIELVCWSLKTTEIVMIPSTAHLKHKLQIPQVERKQTRTMRLNVCSEIFVE